jgi:hypothetical protein
MSKCTSSCESNKTKNDLYFGMVGVVLFCSVPFFNASLVFFMVADSRTMVLLNNDVDNVHKNYK